MTNNKDIYIASDHAGFELKTKILESLKYSFSDLGTKNNDSVDYPDYAKKLILKVKNHNKSKGILICGSGVGMAIAANRNKKIRAGLAFNAKVAKLIRKHNDANVLVLPGKYMNVQEALKCVKNFLNTDFEGGRHKNRIKKLS